MTFMFSLTTFSILVPEHAPALNDQFFVCRRCTIFFRTRKLRKQHNLEHHRRKVNGELIVSEKTKQRQRRSSANKDPFICDKCEKVFRQKALLRSHMNTHMKEPCFFCPLCPYASKRNNDLKKHHETHHNPERVVIRRIRRRKCEKCEEILDGKKAYKLHLRQKHPPESPVRKVRIFKKPCEKCEEVLEGMKAYRAHMKEKHAIAPAEIRCETCHRRFKTNHRLKKHNLKFSEFFLNLFCDIFIVFNIFLFLLNFK
jgi:Zinc finger, C2H2 type